MTMDEKKILGEEALKAVSGGASNTAEFTQKRDEFDKAWSLLKMQSKGYSGMAKAEFFDEWEEKGYPGDATSFLLGKN